MYLLHILFYHAKRDSKREIPTSVKQDGGSGVKPGEQANTEPEEGGGRKQGSNQANDERKVKILHQPLQLWYSESSSLPMICRKTNGVADATYGGYHISYEVKKLMYEIPKSCSLVCPYVQINQCFT